MKAGETIAGTDCGNGVPRGMGGGVGECAEEIKKEPRPGRGGKLLIVKKENRRKGEKHGG